MATHSSILAWRIPWTRGAWPTTVQGVAKGQTLTHTQMATPAAFVFFAVSFPSGGFR